MRHITTSIIPVILVVTLAAGCNQGEQYGKAEQQKFIATDTVSVTQGDACVVVLVPPVNNGSESINEIDVSIAQYQQAVPDTSVPLQHLERLGWAYVEKARDSRDPGFYKLAELTAECIEKQAADSAGALLLHGHVLHNLHQFREAEALARQLVELRGDWFDYALLGDVLVERGALDEATDAYQKVIDERPGPQAYARVAHLRWLKGDLDGALEMMALAARSTSPRTPEAAAWVHVRLALLLMQAGELPTADVVLTRALSLKPEYPPALHARGRILLAQQQPSDAIPFLQRAVQADALPEFRWTLYEALLTSGQQKAAAVQADAIHQFGEVEDRRTFALYLATAGTQSDVALQLARQELELRRDVFTLDAFAWALHAAGQNKEALDYSRRALSEGTQDARLYLHAGVIAAHTGDSERALDLLNMARMTKHMLLPSEQQHLAIEFAALQLRIPARSAAIPASRTLFTF